jgi:hypothetical protein
MVFRRKCEDGAMSRECMKIAIDDERDEARSSLNSPKNVSELSRYEDAYPLGLYR